MKNIGYKQIKLFTLVLAGVVAGSAVNVYAQVPGIASQVTTGAQKAAQQTGPAAPEPTQAGEGEAKEGQAADTAGATTTAAAPAPAEPAPLDTSVDPSENFNRAMFVFNEKFDQYILKPVATLYTKIVPRPLFQGLHNAYNNIGELPTMANDLLQINIYQFANDFWRFGVNSTVGIGGLFDIATRIKLRYYQNDFGLTMAAYGYDDSSYLVLPFLGPTTWRDGVIGFPVDYFAFSIYPYIYPESTRYELYALGVVDRRAQLIQFENVVEEAAIDKYVFTRDAYMQRRAYQIRENQHLGYEDQQGLTDEDASDTNSQET